MVFYGVGVAVHTRTRSQGACNSGINWKVGLEIPRQGANYINYAVITILTVEVIR